MWNTHLEIRNYIRHEIFQADKNSEEKVATHVTSPYLISQIKDQCPDVIQFVTTQKKKNAKSKMKANTLLNDINFLTHCGKRVARNQVLSTILHEMGHSFGLGHNFKGSIDKDNYYKSSEEIRSYFPGLNLISEEIAKSSSVMDYLPLNVLPITFPGKYDLAALKFLYMDQVEKKEEGILYLNIPDDPSQQKALVKQEELLFKMKPYLHCSDEMSNKLLGENFLCAPNDYGSNPEEMIQYEKATAKQRFNYRYRYDLDIKKFHPGYILSFIGNITRLAMFQDRWIELRDQYLKSKGKEHKDRYIISSDDIPEEEKFAEYQQSIKGEGTDTEYEAYYNTRGHVFELFMDFLFLESMKCIVKNDEGKQHSINLEEIKERLSPTEYVEDCNTEIVKQFLADDKLRLVGQKGIEDFRSNSYYSLEKNNIRDVMSLSYLFDELQEGDTVLYKMIKKQLLLGFTSEPDFFEKFRLKLEEYILYKEDLSYTDLHRVNELYDEFIFNIDFRLNTPAESNIRLSNRDYFRPVLYIIETGHPNSFHQKVQKDLENNDINIEKNRHSLFNSGSQSLSGKTKRRRKNFSKVSY